MNNLTLMGIRHMLRNVVISNQLKLACGYASAASNKFPKKTFENSTDFVKKQKLSPKITLISSDDSVSIVGLDEAQRISKRRDLKLVKIIDLDMKTQRAVYKLMSGSEYHTEELKRREEKKKLKSEQTIKGEKLLSLGGRISEHDLHSKLQTTIKWLQKQYEVRVVISGDSGDSEKAEKIFSTIEKDTMEFGKIVQKRNKDNNVRFQIIPNSLKKEKEDKESEQTVPKVVNTKTADNPILSAALNHQQIRSMHNDS